MQYLIYIKMEYIFIIFTLFLVSIKIKSTGSLLCNLCVLTYISIISFAFCRMCIA